MLRGALEFEWDEAKSARNQDVRGFDFNYASQIFNGAVLEEEDRRRNYGERRILAIGEVETDLFVEIYTWRGAPRRIISARRAKRRERNAYRKANPR